MNQTLSLKFSHMGFYVTDLDRVANFYTDILGFTITDRGHLEGPEGPQLIFLSRDPDEHHQIVLASGRPATLSFNVINQISLKADSLETLQHFHARLLQTEATDIAPVTHGNALSVYFRDPEGNRIELYIDTPWYVSQPCRIAAPFQLPADELMAWAENHARTLSGFKSRSEWRAEMALRMGLNKASNPNNQLLSTTL